MRALGQRVQFPSQVPGGVSPPSGIGVPSGVGSPAFNSPSLPYSAGQTPTVPSIPQWDPYSQGPAVGFGSGPLPAGNPYGTPQPTLPAYPSQGQPYSQPSFPQQPGSALSNGLPFSWQQGSYSYQGSDGNGVKYQRFLQNIGFEHTWLADLTDEEKKFAVNKTEVWSTFAIPIFFNTETPLRVTPGFAAHFLEGPVTLPPKNADLPSRLFDAYLDGAWEPKVNEWLSGDLGLRVGVYSDFRHVTSNSVRFMGRGLGVLQFTPTIRVAAGVWYLDRNNVKLLPAGGVIWTPNADTNFRMLFPNPKLSHRFKTMGTTEWWWYFAGEYGGGAWTVRRAGGNDRIDYNDIRASFGLEWIGQRGVRGHIEIGYVWDREIIFVDTNSPRDFKPDDTVMLRAGIDY